MEDSRVFCCISHFFYLCAFLEKLDSLKSAKCPNLYPNKDRTEEITKP